MPGTDEHTVAGGDSASASLYFMVATIFLLVLLLSKMSSNLKSLIKDEHWMQRVELVLDRLGRAGIRRQESIVDIMQDASMSNYVWPQPNAPAAPGSKTYGIHGGYGGKAALAPPSSGAEDLDAIAACNVTDNTIDGARRGMGHPAEAHL